MRAMSAILVDDAPQAEFVLASALDCLESDLPRLMREYPDIGDFLDAFGELAESIAAHATPDEHAYIDQRIDGMLVLAGLHCAPRPHQQPS
jgi:hypothetical protein